MAELQNKIDITVEDLEENLGAKKLPLFIRNCEKNFIDRIETIVEEVCNNLDKKAVFVSGPTSSGKTPYASCWATTSSTETDSPPCCGRL